MNASISYIRLSAYLSGVALGAAALIVAVAPRLQLGAPKFGESSPSCAARMSQHQVTQLRDAVIDAQSRRDGLTRGGSFYAAAKVGVIPDQVDAAAVQGADRAVRTARARFLAACA